MREYVLITGASRGIGRETALLFAQKGYNVVIVCKREARKLLELSEEIKGYGVGCEIYIGDIGDYEFCNSMFASIEDNQIFIRYLINNAGIAHVGLLQDMSINQWNHIVNTNLTSVFSTTSLAIPNMIRHGCGRIINISSIWGNVGASCEVAYSATKGGVNAYTMALAKELAPSGIQVNAVAFGAIDTDMNRNLTEDEIEQLKEEIPAGRLGTAEEAANMIYTVATSCDYLTGQIITMNGGF